MPFREALSEFLPQSFRKPLQLSSGVISEVTEARVAVNAAQLPTVDDPEPYPVSLHGEVSWLRSFSREPKCRSSLGFI